MAKPKQKGNATLPPGRKGTRRWWLGLALVPPLTALAALGGVLPLQPKGTETAQPGAPPSSIRTVDERPSAPDFTVATTDGSNFRLSDHNGKALVVLFTAPG